MRTGIVERRPKPCLNHGLRVPRRRARLQKGGIRDTMRNVKIIVEKHDDGYVAYPLGLKGVVVGQGDSYEEAMAEVRSAIRFHIETFGKEVLLGEPPVLEAFVAEVAVAI